MPHLRHTFFVLLCNAICVIHYAQAENSESLPRNLYLRMQTGYQSPALGDQAKLSGAWDLDLAFGYSFPHLVLEANLGLSLSPSSTQLSNVARMTSYTWSKAEGLMYYRLGVGRHVLFLGGGVGLRLLSRSIDYEYQEGDLLQITSETERSVSEQVLTTLIRAVVVLKSNLLFAFDYDRFALDDQPASINTLGINIGFIF